MKREELEQQLGDPCIIRKLFSEGDEVRDAGLSVPEDMERETNIQYGSDPEWNLLDVYYKKGTVSLLPAIISIHGGAWVYGDKERYQFYCMDLAKRGFVVVNFTYRLAPEHKFPSALEDINAVFQWIVRAGEKHKINKQQIFVVGDSAGAQLASQYLTLLTNEEYRKKFEMDIPYDQMKIRAAALNCGIYEGQAIIQEKIAKSYFEKEPELYLEQMDVTKYIKKGFPPTFIMTSYYDFLRENAKPFYELLCEKGIHSEYKLYGTEGQNEMAHVFHLNIRLPGAKECNDDECSFFKKFYNC